MKILGIIFSVLIICCSCFNIHAQQLSKADLQTIKDIKIGIDSVNKLSSIGFKNLILHGEVAKDTDVVLYNANAIELLHGSKYSILNYFKGKKNIYVCAYDNPHEVMLAEKAIEELGFKLGSKWELYQTKVDTKDYTTNKLYYNGKWVAYYEKPNDGKSMQLSFIGYYNDDSEDKTNINAKITQIHLLMALQKIWTR